MASPTTEQVATDAPFSFPRLMSGSVLSVAERADDSKKSRFSFELDLKWSDGNDTTCFRGYQEFFQFHCELLDSFPQDAGNVKGHERIIPYLPGKQIFRRSTKGLALQRLPKLHQYLQEITGLPERITTSEVVLKFFRENWEQERLRYKYTVQSKDADGTTPDELLKSIEAVKVDDGTRVRFINESRTEQTDEGYMNEGFAGSMQDEEESQDEEGAELTMIDNPSIQSDQLLTLDREEVAETEQDDREREESDEENDQKQLLEESDDDKATAKERKTGNDDRKNEENNQNQLIDEIDDEEATTTEEKETANDDEKNGQLIEQSENKETEKGDKEETDDTSSDTLLNTH